MGHLAVDKDDDSQSTVVSNGSEHSYQRYRAYSILKVMQCRFEEQMGLHSRPGLYFILFGPMKQCSQG